MTLHISLLHLEAIYMYIASRLNVVLIIVWGHKLQCMFEENAKDN